MGTRLFETMWMAENDTYKDIDHGSTDQLASLDGIGLECLNSFSFLAFKSKFHCFRTQTYMIGTHPIAYMIDVYT
jgi:hypothetical protein